jgi:hypothetical protein
MDFAGSDGEAGGFRSDGPGSRRDESHFHRDRRGLVVLNADFKSLAGAWRGEDLVGVDADPAGVESEVGFAFGEKVAEEALLGAELLFGGEHDGLVDRVGLAVAGADQLGLVVDEVADGLQVAVVFDMVAEDEVVAESAVVTGIGEEGVAAEGNTASVDGDERIRTPPT